MSKKSKNVQNRQKSVDFGNSLWIRSLIGLIVLGLFLIAPVFINYDQLASWGLENEALKWTSIVLLMFATLVLLISIVTYLIMAMVKIIKGFRAKKHYQRSHTMSLILGFLAMVMFLLMGFVFMLASYWIMSIIEALDRAKDLDFDQQLLFVFNSHISQVLKDDPFKTAWLSTTFWQMDPNTAYLIISGLILSTSLLNLIYNGLLTRKPKVKSATKLSDEEIKKDTEVAKARAQVQLIDQDWIY